MLFSKFYEKNARPLTKWFLTKSTKLNVKVAAVAAVAAATAAVAAAAAAAAAAVAVADD